MVLRSEYLIWGGNTVWLFLSYFYLYTNKKRPEWDIAVQSFIQVLNKIARVLSNALWCIWDMVRAPHGWVVCSGLPLKIVERGWKKKHKQILVAPLTEMHQIPNVVLVTGRLKGKWKASMPRIFIILFQICTLMCILPGRPFALIVKGHSIPGEN